jgi:alpha-beta hydrolase superfamily lysophospholipase
MVYIGVGLLLFLVQDIFLFHPTPLPANHKFSFQQDFEEENITINDRNLHFIKFHPTKEKKGLVLFFHGNMKNVEHYRTYPGFFTDKGYEVWMPDYPGFGKSTGKRSEENMNQDALLLYDRALENNDAANILLYGKSMGTGVASFTASKRDSRQLILETPYYSIRALARQYLPVYPVGLLAKYSFPVNQYLQDVKEPVTIIHGSNDEIISVKQSRKLKKEHPAASLIEIEGGKHNNLASFDLFKQTLDSLLQ